MLHSVGGAGERDPGEKGAFYVECSIFDSPYSFYIYVYIYILFFIIIT